MKNKCLDCGKECFGKRCKGCSRKFIGKTFDFDRWHFDTQTDLDKAIKERIFSIFYNQESNDEFVLAVINNLHTDVIKRGLKCTKIKVIDWDNQIREWEWCRKRFRGNIFTLGYFEPIGQWHGVTRYPYKRSPGKIRPKLIACLRQKWSEQAEVRDPNAVCEKCGCKENLQLHHDNIEFKEIAEECLPYFSEKELKEGIGDDWWWHESEADAIKDSHPAVQHMLKLHEKVIYKWLCRDCHSDTF